jgi:hypothetical protein
MSEIIQKCKESNVEMYIPIWNLMFKCNGSGIQFKSIQFSQKYNNQRNARKKSKDKIRTQDVTEFGFNNAYVSGTLNIQQLRLSRYIKKKSFYTCRTWSLTQKWAAKPIGSTSDNTLKNNEHYISRKS